MKAAVGIDPGSKTMDICMLCDGKVCYEKSYETMEIALKPYLLVEEIAKLSEKADLIALPSGYGVEVTSINSIPNDVFEEWYYTFILATRKSDILKAMEKGVVGARVYYAMAESAKAIRDMNIPGVFIPGIINLPTIPVFRKLNKVDMGTADKLSVVVLGIEEMAEERNGDYSRVNYIHVEAGFGYASIVAVKEGKITDAYGGTTTPGPAFLTAGSLDLEVVQAVERFDKIHVFTTGCSQMLQLQDLDLWIKMVEEGDEKAAICYEAFVESIVKSVYSLLYAVRSPQAILLSGRFSRYKLFLESLSSRLSNIATVRKMRGLKAGIAKETAQGYAVVADGLSGGIYSELVRHVEIPWSSGSSLDYILVKDFLNTELGRSYLKLRKTLKGPAFNLRWWGIESSS